jgi:hypothetical protein
MRARFDMIVDVNSNGQYDEGIDALDGDDIELVAGFVIIPELIAILQAFMIATLTASILLRRGKRNMDEMSSKLVSLFTAPAYASGLN